MKTNIAFFIAGAMVVGALMLALELDRGHQIAARLEQTHSDPAQDKIDKSRFVKFDGLDVPSSEPTVANMEIGASAYVHSYNVKLDDEGYFCVYSTTKITNRTPVDFAVVSRLSEDEYHLEVGMLRWRVPEPAILAHERGCTYFTSVEYEIADRPWEAESIAKF